MAKTIPIEQRFWMKVKKTDSCWLWTGMKDRDGYGKIKKNKKTIRAHRLSYEIHFETHPKDLLVRHKCDVPACVNPEHLFLGTSADNTHDRHAKGRTAKGNARIDQEKADEIRRLFFLESKNQSEIARLFGVTQACIWLIVENRTWKSETSKIYEGVERQKIRRTRIPRIMADGRTSLNSKITMLDALNIKILYKNGLKLGVISKMYPQLKYQTVYDIASGRRRKYS